MELRTTDGLIRFRHFCHAYPISATLSHQLTWSHIVRVAQPIAGYIREVAGGYATPWPELTNEVAMLASREEEHFEWMGAAWK